VENAFYGSRTFTPSYDTLGRATGYSYNGASIVSATIGYDGTTGRVNSIAGALGSTSTTFALGYSGGTDWVNSASNGSYSRSTPLSSDLSSPLGKYDVIASATTKWSTTTIGSFTAKYTDVRGWRNEHDVAASSYATALGFSSGLNTPYTFDSYGQLWTSTGSVGARSFTWVYDLAGNRSTEVANSATTNYVSDTRNCYSSITGNLAESPLTYDADGNLTQDGTWTYGYDGENRLKSMTKSGQSLTFLYDYAGRRASKTVSGTTTVYLWAGWNVAAELASDGVTPTRVFVWGKDFSSVLGNAGGAGSLLAQISGTSIACAVPDALGNIVGYVDLGSGTLNLAVEYSPYGKALSWSGTYSNYPIGFSGHYMDWETGLVYYGMRYYEPKHGRFINRDVIKEQGGNNLFGFCGNRPTGRYDVLGLGQSIDPYNNLQGGTPPGFQKLPPNFDPNAVWKSNDPVMQAKLNYLRAELAGGTGGALNPYGLPTAESLMFSGLDGDDNQFYPVAGIGYNGAVDQITNGRATGQKFYTGSYTSLDGAAPGGKVFTVNIGAPMRVQQSDGTWLEVAVPQDQDNNQPDGVIYVDNRVYASAKAAAGTNQAIPIPGRNASQAIADKLKPTLDFTGYIGTVLDLAKNSGYIGKQTADIVEAVSRNLGRINLVGSAVVIITDPANAKWTDYVDVGLGVASLAAGEVLAPWVAAGAAAFTIWEVTTDLTNTNASNTNLQEPPRH